MGEDKDHERELETPTESLWDEPLVDVDGPQPVDDPTSVYAAPPRGLETTTNASQPGSETGPTPTVTIAVTPLALIGVLAAIALIVGSIGPWVSAGVFSASGSAGDGLITLVAGVVALIPAALGRWPGAILAAALLASAVTIYDLARIIPLTGDAGFLPVMVGWGLVLATVAAVGLLIVALIGLGRSASPPVAIASGSLAGVVVVALVALGALGAFDEERLDQGETTADVRPATPTPQPTPSDGLSNTSCSTAGITTTGTAAGPCKSDATGQAVWVAPRGRAATLDGLSAAIESITTATVIDPGDGYSDPIVPEGEFVIVRIRVKNTGTSSLSLQSGNFGLRTAGALYEPADDSDLAMLDDQLPGGSSLGPGLTRRGVVIFDVPRSRIPSLRSSGVVIVAPQDWIDEYDQGARLTIRLAYLQTRGVVRSEYASRGMAPRGSAAEVAGEEPTTRACDQNISANSDTTCDFASETFKSYAAEIQSGSPTSLTVSAYSGAAGASIDMDCIDDSGQVTCTGGNAAYVTFPRWAAEVY